MNFSRITTPESIIFTVEKQIKALNIIQIIYSPTNTFGSNFDLPIFLLDVILANEIVPNLQDFLINLEDAITSFQSKDIKNLIHLDFLEDAIKELDALGPRPLENEYLLSGINMLLDAEKSVKERNKNDATPFLDFYFNKLQPDEDWLLKLFIIFKNFIDENLNKSLKDSTGEDTTIGVKLKNIKNIYYN